MLTSLLNRSLFFTLLLSASACAKTPLKVCRISLVDVHAGLLVLRDNPLPDEFELLGSAAWIDGQPAAPVAPEQDGCTMRQVVARARVGPGEHHVVIASVIAGRGLWSGATWQACQELRLRFPEQQAVVVRTGIEKRAAVDPFERVGFALSVRPHATWVDGQLGAQPPSPGALALCRSLAGYDAAL